MQRALSVLIILGIIIWSFFLLQRVMPAERVADIIGKADDANMADRCAEYRMASYDDGSSWSLGYGGRIRQLLHGCF